MSAAALLGELGGTALLVFIGLMAEAQTATAPDGSLGGAVTVAVAWGVAVLLACYGAGRISGAHLNPAVTLALAICGRAAWRTVGPYWAAQLVGALLGGLGVRVLTAPLIQRFDPGLTLRSQAVFSTLPGTGVPIIAALANEVAGTAVLVIGLLVLLDRAAESRLLADLEPLLMGLVVIGIGLSMGSLSGWAINPARDLPPRVIEAVTGYRSAWQDQTGRAYWWVPVVGPLLGGVAGATLWRLVDCLRPARDPGVVDRGTGGAAPTSMSTSWPGVGMAGSRPTHVGGVGAPPDRGVTQRRSPSGARSAGSPSGPSAAMDECSTDHLLPTWTQSRYAADLAPFIPPDLAWRGEDGDRQALQIARAYEAGREFGGHNTPGPARGGPPRPRR